MLHLSSMCVYIYFALISRFYAFSGNALSVHPTRHKTNMSHVTDTYMYAHAYIYIYIYIYSCKHVHSVGTCAGVEVGGGVSCGLSVACLGCVGFLGCGGCSVRGGGGFVLCDLPMLGSDVSVCGHDCTSDEASFLEKEEEEEEEEKEKKEESFKMSCILAADGNATVMLSSSKEAAAKEGERELSRDVEVPEFERPISPLLAFGIGPWPFTSAAELRAKRLCLLD